MSQITYSGALESAIRKMRVRIRAFYNPSNPTHKFCLHVIPTSDSLNPYAILTTSYPLQHNSWRPTPDDIEQNLPAGTEIPMYQLPTEVLYALTYELDESKIYAKAKMLNAEWQKC